MPDNLTNLADYSRQVLQVGTPPLNIYTEGGARPSQDIIQLSLLARIAEALEDGRIQLPTAVFPIQPRHADEFITLLNDLVADRPGRIYIVAWHLKDEYTVDVTLAYERGESLIYLGRYWEQQRAEELAAPADENSEDPNTWVLPQYCDSLVIRQEIAELQAAEPEGHPSYQAGLLRRFLEQESQRRQLLINAEGSPGNA